MKMVKNHKNQNNPVDDMYNVGIDNFSNKEQQQIYKETQAGAELLRQTTIDSSLSTASTKSDLTVEQAGLKYENDIHSFTGFSSAIDELLEEVKDTRKGLSKRKLSKAGKKTIKEAKIKLKQYEKQLIGKKEGLKRQSEREITDEEIGVLKNIWENLNEVRKNIGMGQWGEFASTASYVYNSPENIRKSNKRQANNLEFRQRLQGELKDGAILHIFNGKEQKANDFYRKIAEGKYTHADYELFIRNSSVLTPSFQRCGIAVPTRPIQNTGTRSVERMPKTIRQSIDYSNMDWGETLEKGGVAGVLDKLLSNCNNMTPGQRNTRKSLGVLAGFAGGIYGLYKFYTNDKMGLWTKAGITAGAIFGSQALTGEGPLSLFNKLMTGGLSMGELKNKFGDAVGGLGISGSENPETITGTGGESISETIVPSMYSMMIFNSSTKVSDIRDMTKTFKNNKAWKDFYEKSYKKLGKNYSAEAAECFQATFSNEFDEDKRKNRLAGFGITDSTDNNESIYGLANNAIMNETILEKFKTENGLIENSEDDSLKEYIEEKKSSNEPIDVDDLNKHSGRFVVNAKATNTERRIDEENRNKLVNMVDSLSLDDTKKEELKTAIQEFYDKRTIENKPNLDKFNLKMDGDSLILTSHGGYETKINLKNRSLEGFGSGDGIPFTNLSDLLNAADLTNKILESQKGKIAVDYPPFQYKGPTSILKTGVGKGGRGIYFNNAKGVRNDLISFNRSGTDTRVLSSGLWGASNKIDEIDKHLEDYAEYLSKRWMKLSKEKPE